MYDGLGQQEVRPVLVINLPTIRCTLLYRSSRKMIEKRAVYPNSDGVGHRLYLGSDYGKGRYPYMPDRIVDNLIKPSAKVGRWRIGIRWTGWTLGKLPISHRSPLFNDREACEYDPKSPDETAPKCLVVSRIPGPATGVAMVAATVFVFAPCLHFFRERWAVETSILMRRRIDRPRRHAWDESHSVLKRSLKTSDPAGHHDRRL